MKPIKSSDLFGSVPAVVLYRDELEQVVAIVSAPANTETVYELGGMMYDSLDELQSHRGEFLRELAIKCKQSQGEYRYSNYSSISLGDTHNHLHFDSAHELQYLHVRDLLVSHRAWAWWLSEPYGFGLLVGIWFLLFVASVAVWQVEGYEWLAMVLSLALLAYGIATLSGKVRVGRNALFLTRRHEHLGFLRRNEGALVKAVVGLAGALFGYIFRAMTE